MRVVTFKIDEDLLMKIEAIAIEKKMYRSEVIRLAIEKFVDEYYKRKENNSEPLSIKVEKIKI